MGNLKAEYLEQTYIDLAPLKDAEDCRTYLTRSQVDGSLAVRKEIIALQYPLYQQFPPQSGKGAGYLCQGWKILCTGRICQWLYHRLLLEKGVSFPGRGDLKLHIPAVLCPLLPSCP